VESVDGCVVEEECSNEFTISGMDILRFERECMNGCVGFEEGEQVGEVFGLH